MDEVKTDWVKEFQAEFPQVSEVEAAEAFRAVLHSIRDRMPLAELANFGSALPASVRGEFYGAWTPGARDFSPEFEEDVRRRLGPLSDRMNATQAVRAAWRVLDRHLDEPSLDMLHVFPRSVGNPSPFAATA